MQKSSTYIPSLDFLRLFAIILVSLQHGLSVIDREDLTMLYGMSIGQYGVSIFCVLSGFLVSKDSRPPYEWIKHRFGLIFPPYWIIMLLSFFLAWLTKYKTFDAYQFFSQMLGLGFFTHGWDLINVVSWFISLIIICYLQIFVAKMSRRPVLLILLFTVIAIMLLYSRIELSLSRHIISFNLAFIAGYLFKRHSIVTLDLCIFPLLLLSLFRSLQYSYATVGLFFLLSSLLFPNLQIKRVQQLSKYIYEYFLVHGIFFVGAVKIIGGFPIIALFIGVVSSIFAAWGLKYSVYWLHRYWREFLSRPV